MSKSENKTQPTALSVTDFLNVVEHPTRRADGLVLDQLFRDVTGFNPVMWGPTLVGYGQYHYKYASGREGDFLATGFSPRKASLSIYIMPGYSDFAEIMSRLGKHKTGRACVYVNKLADIDMDVLAELIRAGLRDLADFAPIRPS